MDRHYPRNRTLMWIFFAALVVLHHDWWLWNDGRLVFGFLPIGLGYQVLISLAAVVLGLGWPFTPGRPNCRTRRTTSRPAKSALGNHHPGRPCRLRSPRPRPTRLAKS